MLALGGGVWLFDCGDGTSRQIHSSNVRPSRIEAVFITHLHGDHFYGLPGLSMRLIGSRERPTKLFAPAGVLKSLGTSLSHKRHAFDIHELRVSPLAFLSPGAQPVPFDRTRQCFDLFDNGVLRVRAVPIEHSVFCLGFVVEEITRPRLDADKLVNAYGLTPGPQFKDLAAGASIATQDGRVVK